MKKCLVARYGGIGDAIMLTPVLKELAKDYLIYFAVPYDSSDGIRQIVCNTSGLFENVDFIHKVLKITCIAYAHFIKLFEDYVPLASLVEGEYFDKIIDYRNIIELNTPNTLSFNPQQNSRNSNLFNICDLAFGWAGINYKTITDKQPVIGIDVKKKKYFKQVLEDYNFTKYKIIGIQTFASNVTRRIEYPHNLYDTFYKIFDKKDYAYAVFYDAGNVWHFYTPDNNEPIEIITPDITDTVALMLNFKGLISADTGLSHIAEAIKLLNVTVYTTVPSWTRCEHYKYTFPVDSHCTEWENGCFTLRPFCQLEEKKAWEGLAVKEKQIMELTAKGYPPQIIAQKVGIELKVMLEEAKLMQQRLQYASKQKPYCVKNIKFNDLLTKLKGVLEKNEISL